ncbi:MAG: DUF2784 domain-containing protein [Aquificaceae bacterium]|jgi:hypothetical protein|uniref:DUF2784 domain-containing protein n=1 Tax=Hydrogenobacter sp. Uz 6-8 TaxID=3384828 RepID=UPI000F21979F|nr:MAG: DUF2784 domain-containing protein [Aquificota bacterium]
MKELYLFLAHVVVFVHFLWIVFLLTGWVFSLRFRAIRWLHMGGVLFALFLNITKLHCPLTYLEIWLRKKAGAQAYDSSFIIHYLEKLIYIRIEPELLRLLTYLFVVFFLVFYGLLWLKNRASNQPF